MDDDETTLTTIGATLGRASFDVTCVRTMPEARHALAKSEFHLVLTDLYLGSDGLGYDVAEAARGCRPSVPVVLLTGRPSFVGACEALRSQVAEIVVKPVREADLIAVCDRTIQNSMMRRRTEELEVQNRVLARVIPRAIEAKDPTTRGHSERVVQYADRLAERCGVSQDDRASLRAASLLHDVGKVAVPDSILTKKGALTREEREIIQRHPGDGYLILEPLVGCEDVRLWVYQHHERWDGRGYPNGLQADEVALPGRILILAEVYDALVEARSYKQPWPVSRIVDYFRSEAGKHFDPDLAHLVADGLGREGTRFFAEAGQLW